MTVVKVFAPAKINLALHVTGRRADGYHLLDTLVAFADVGDVLKVSAADDLAITVTGPEAAGIPGDATNLALRAAAVFAEARGARIALEKRLPPASGIGGGSADAAAALRGMLALRRLGPRALAEQAADAVAFRERAAEILSLGADVPMCLFPRPFRARGIGERLDPVTLPPLPAVLANPRLPVATPAVFGALDRRENPALPDPLPGLASAAEAATWLAGQRNDLERPAMRLQPSVATVLAALAATEDCLLARMSGSGATCFALYAHSDAAERAADRLRAERPGWWITATILGDQTAQSVPIPA